MCGFHPESFCCQNFAAWKVFVFSTPDLEEPTVRHIWKKAGSWDPGSQTELSGSGLVFFLFHINPSDLVPSCLASPCESGPIDQSESQLEPIKISLNAPASSSDLAPIKISLE